MITLSQKAEHQYFGKIMVFLITIILVALFAFTDKPKFASSKGRDLKEKHKVKSTDTVPRITIVSAVNNSDLTTLYIGANNRVKVNVPGVKPENLLVKLSNGTIEGNNGLYSARVTFIGGTFIEIYSNIDGVEEKLAEKRLETLPIPPPGSANFNEAINSLGLHIADSIPTSKIPPITQSNLRKASVTSLLGLPPATKVMSYTFTIDTENGDITETCNSGMVDRVE